MYRVTRKAVGTLFTQGIEFVQDKEVTVSKQVFDYLQKTFPNDFVFEGKKEKTVKKEATGETKTREKVVGRKPRGANKKDS